VLGVAAPRRRAPALPSRPSRAARRPRRGRGHPALHGPGPRRHAPGDRRAPARRLPRSRVLGRPADRGGRRRTADPGRFGGALGRAARRARAAAAAAPAADLDTNRGLARRRQLDPGASRTGRVRRLGGLRPPRHRATALAGRPARPRRPHDRTHLRLRVRVGEPAPAGSGHGRPVGSGILFGDEGPSTPLRSPDEPVRHKALDAIGDFALLGRPLAASVRIHRGSHRAHIAAMRRLRHLAPPPRPSEP
jgi:hypothetical protein